MSRINHNRPELRLRDNWKRELSKILELQEKQRVDLQWPEFLRPLAAKPKTLEALFILLESFNTWFDEIEENGKQFSFANPPSYFSRSYRTFLGSKVQNRYDAEFTVRDWLCQIEPEGQKDHRDFRPFLVELGRYI